MLDSFIVAAGVFFGDSQKEMRPEVVGIHLRGLTERGASFIKPACEEERTSAIRSNLLGKRIDLERAINLRQSLAHPSLRIQVVGIAMAGLRVTRIQLQGLAERSFAGLPVPVTDGLHQAQNIVRLRRLRVEFKGPLRGSASFLHSVKRWSGE